MIRKILSWTALLILLLVGGAVVALYQGDLGRDYIVEKYASPASRFVELPSGAVAHIRDEGRQDGTALLLVHGSNASLHTWEPWVKALGERYRVVTLDLPGHGITGEVPNADYSRKGMVAFVDEVVTHLGIERFALAGNSMGGGVTLLYTLTHPEKVSHMILVCSAGLPPFPDEANEPPPLAFRLAMNPVTRPLIRYIGVREVIGDAVKATFVDKSLVTEEMIDRYHELLLYDGNRAATAARFSLGRRFEDVEAVKGIATPTLVMWGDKDPLINVRYAREFARLIPDADLVIYENVGHIPMEEVAARSATDVDAFLRRAGG